MPGLGVLDELQSLPVGHQPFHEVVGLLVVGGRELRGVGRIEVGQIRLHLRQELVHVLPAGLALLAVVEDQRVDAGHVLAEPFPELLRRVLALAVPGGRGEVPETALAGHAGLAQGEEGDVLLVTLELVDVGADGVDQPVDALGEEDALEVVPDEGARLGVVGEQHLQVVVGEADVAVLDDGPGGVVAVAQPVVGQDLQALGLVHVGHHARAREGIDDRLHVLRRVLPDPVDQLLLRPDVVGDVLRPLVRRQFLGDELPGPGFEGLEVQVQGGVRLQEERQPFAVGGEKFHPALRSHVMTWPPSGPPRGGQRDAVGGYLPEAAEKCREGSQEIRPERILSRTARAQASAEGYSSVSTTGPRMPRYGERVA